jgi:rod shape determining protein RodA
MRLEVKTLKNLDFIILAVVIMISTFGIIMISSATNNLPNSEAYIQTQLTSTILGFIVITVILFFDYKTFGNFYLVIYAFSILLLIAVLIAGVGGDDWGANRWLYIGGFGFQPSDFAKIGIIISLARVISEHHETINEFKTLGKIVAITALPMGLVYMQPDLGTTMVFPVFTFAMLFVAGLKYKYILVTFLVALGSAPFAWNYLNEYQQRRIMVFINPTLDPMGDAYQITQSIYAVGSGMLTGKGFNEGIQSQLGFLPEKHTDFIFSVIAEELGFVGVSILLFLYIVLLIKGISVARQSKDLFGSLLAIGIVSMLAFHIFANIMMTIGLMPVTGKPLPFISYGGTFMLSNMIAIGLLLNISMRKKRTNY